MIQIGTTSDGKIIEIPDMFIYTLVILFVITLFALSNKKSVK